MLGILIEGGSYPIYVPTGHLLYARENTVMAVPFDAQSLEIRGRPMPILEGVVEHGSGAAHLSVSQLGTLVRPALRPLFRPRDGCFGAAVVG